MVTYFMKTVIIKGDTFENNQNTNGILFDIKLDASIDS